MRSNRGSRTAVAMLLMLVASATGAGDKAMDRLTFSGGFLYEHHRYELAPSLRYTPVNPSDAPGTSRPTNNPAEHQMAFYVGVELSVWDEYLTVGHQLRFFLSKYSGFLEKEPYLDPLNVDYTFTDIESVDPVMNVLTLTGRIPIAHDTYLTLGAEYYCRYRVEVVRGWGRHLARDPVFLRTGGHLTGLAYRVGMSWKSKGGGLMEVSYVIGKMPVEFEGGYPDGTLTIRGLELSNTWTF